MSLTLDVARVAAALNVLLLVVTLGVWVRTLRQIRSKQTFGSLVFGLFLLCENALALYYTVAAIPLSVPAVRAMMYLQILEAVGVAALAYVVWE